jgi:hypothetical protein
MVARKKLPHGGDLWFLSGDVVAEAPILYFRVRG